MSAKFLIIEKRKGGHSQQGNNLSMQHSTAGTGSSFFGSEFSISLTSGGRGEKPAS